MRVSVITIFHNESRFLQEALASVCQQTYGDWEHVLVDDGSTDGSSEIAQRHAASDGRVRYVAHAGHTCRGMSASRNAGLAVSTGDVIALLDGDDVWHADKLERQVALFEADPSLGMVYGAPVYWHSWTGDPDDVGRDHFQEIPLAAGTICEPPALAVNFIRCGAATPCTCDLMVRRDVVETVGGFVDAFAGLYEDQVFCLKVALACRIVIGPPALSRYRQRTDSFCARAYAAGDHAAERQRFLQWASRYIVDLRGPQTSALAAAIAEEARRG